MDFYTAIAAYYDRIFPLNKQALAFILERCQPESTILDIGCAAGALSAALAAEGHRVWGIDFDESMITLAKQKGAGTPLELHFAPMDMREVTAHFAKESFSHVLCLGNTLVHLEKSDLQAALSSAYDVLQTGGTYVLQILNYDYIVDKKIENLPLIENNFLTFERHYRFSGNQIEFDTCLTLKANREVLQNSIPLYPLRKKELTDALTEAGFIHIECFGNFQGEPLGSESLPLVLTARKHSGNSAGK